MAEDKKARPRGGGGHRITMKDQRRRVEQVEICLAEGWTIPEINIALSTAWGVSRKSVSRYLSKARNNLATALGETRESHRARSLHFYRQVLQNPSAKVNQKLDAQKQIDRLLGLTQPIMIAPATPEGKSLLEAARELTEEQAWALASLRYALGERNGRG